MIDHVVKVLVVLLPLAVEEHYKVKREERNNLYHRAKEEPESFHNYVNRRKS